MLLNLSRFSLLTLCLSLVLLGCSGKGIRKAESILEDGWARVDKEDSEDEPPLYCYRTLGNVECYTTPDPKRSTQLVTPYPLLKPSYEKKRLKAQKRPVEMRVRDYERNLENLEYEPTLEQKAYASRMDAYVAVQDEIKTAKRFDDALFAKEEKAQRKKLLKTKEAAKKETETAKTPPQRTVTDILSVLRGERPARALKQRKKTSSDQPILTTAPNHINPSDKKNTESPGKPITIK